MVDSYVGYVFVLLAEQPQDLLDFLLNFTALFGGRTQIVLEQKTLVDPLGLVAEFIIGDVIAPVQKLELESLRESIALLESTADEKLT